MNYNKTTRAEAEAYIQSQMAKLAKGLAKRGYLGNYLTISFVDGALMCNNRYFVSSLRGGDSDRPVNFHVDKFYEPDRLCTKDADFRIDEEEEETKEC